MWIKLPTALWAPEGEGTGEGEGQGQGNPPPGGGETPPGAGAGTGEGNGTGGRESAPGEGTGPDWPTMRATVQDEKLRTSLERFNSLADVAAEQDRLRREISDRVRIPGPNATEEDLAKYRKTMGVPENPEGYGAMRLPDGVELTEDDMGFLEVMAPVAFEYNLPLGAFEKIAGELISLAQDQRQAMETQLTNYRKDVETALRKEWGTDFDRRVQLASRVSETLGGQDFVQFLRGTILPDGGALGDHPSMVKMLAGIGGRMSEDDLHIGSSKEEAETAQAELDRLNKEVPIHSKAYTTKEHQAKVQALYAKIHGSKPIVGTEGRTT